MKATIKIVTARKEFTKSDMDAFRRILNVLHEHNLSARLSIKEKTKSQITTYKPKLKAI